MLKYVIICQEGSDRVAELKDVKGIGPKSLALLNKIGIYTVEDLVTHYPFRYEILERNNLQEVADGEGIKATIDGREVSVGNEKLMKEEKIDYKECTDAGTALYVAIDRKYVGYILIADSIKKDSKKAIQNLKKNGIKQTVMLTGDRKLVGEAVAKELGIDKVYTELLPDGKVEKVEELLKEKSSEINI